MLTLIDFPVPISFGLRSISPFGYKAEALVALSKCEYQKKPPTDLALLPHKKVPVLIDKTVEIPDSALIQQHLEENYNLDIDKKMSSNQLAISIAFRRLVENHLYWILVYSRWIDPAGEKMVKDAVFGSLPENMRNEFFSNMREQMRQALYQQGIGRHKSNNIYKFGCEDIRSISSQLADKPFLMGETLTSVDASVVGVLVNIIGTPIDTPLTNYTLSLRPLIEYVCRFERIAFGDKATIPKQLNN